MPTIVFASSKGGCGKSTGAVLLGTEFARLGLNVTMLDCDPNRSLTLWSSAGPLPERIAVINDVTEGQIIKLIQKHDVDGNVVIVDPEGVASRLLSRAISQADLVITPMRGTTLDATVGSRALQVIQEEEEALGRRIPHAIVFTMTKAVRSKQHSGIAKSLREQGVDIIEPELMERAAFSSLFAYGGDLHSMPVQGNLDAAKENASGFARAVITRLTDGDDS
ncbi:ParA family protein [Novosphingobium sp. 9U]|uniref:ParA family protein n=1 Tax=Novosphingobium sp. 9U TaxID=2653158 RepID=UPI0012F2EA14|nr:ParA family protein [Novosphingobium sp. 9U]VWX51035.1 Protein ParA [Novosphingobium sp. 9U]